MMEAEVSFGEQPAVLIHRGVGLVHPNRDLIGFTSGHLIAVKVALIGEGIQVLHAEGVFRLMRHRGQLVRISHRLRDVMGHNQFVLSVHRELFKIYKDLPPISLPLDSSPSVPALEAITTDR